MDWIILAILAPIFWAFNNIIDKIFMGKYVKNPTSYLILILESGLISAPIFYLFLNPISVTKWSFLTIFLGIIQGLSFLFYNKAMKIEEASRVAPILTINPIFTLPLAFIFLGEKLKPLNYIGILLMIIAAILVNYRKTKTSFLSKTLFLTLLTTFIVSLVQIISKTVLEHMDSFTFIFWLTIGFITAGFLLLFPKKNRKELSKEIRNNDIRIVFFMRLISLAIYLAGLIFFYKAVSMGIVSIITALGSIQPFFVLLYAIILTKLKPKLLREEIDKRTLVFKFLSVILIIVGAYFTVL